MTVERSEHGALITNASYLESIAYTHTMADVTWANFTQEDAYTITFTSNKHVTWSPHTTNDYFIPIYVTFSGSVSPSTPLEWAIVYYSGNTNTVRFESDWVSSTQPIYMTSDQKSYNSYFKIKFYVRKADGSALNRNELNNCGFSVVGNVYYTVDYAGQITQTTAIPYEWVTGTSQSFQYDVTTMAVPVVPPICDIDDDDFNAFIDIPNKIVAGLNLCIMGIGSLLNLKYVSFTICFVLIVGLIAWIIH